MLFRSFVAEARKVGYQAWGQDLASCPGMYCGPLESINFPTDWAGTATMHDVLEHVVDPVAALKETARIAKRLIVDFPDFDASEGRHHWKLTEHLWMFSRAELISIIQGAGFQVIKTDSPIPGKFVVYAERCKIKRPRILVPPGIGDIYWIMVKMRGFLKAHGLGLPEIWIDAPDDKKRSLGFVHKIPFVATGGYHETVIPPDTPLAGWEARTGTKATDPVRREAYKKDGRHAFPNVEGFDWFLSWNGSMNVGRRLEDTEYETDWDIPFFVSIEETQFGERFEVDGPYIIACFFSSRMYRKWLDELPAPEIYEMLSTIHDNTGMRIVLTGAAWDQSSLINGALLRMDEKHGRLVNMIGKTTLDEYFGLLRSSSGCIGFPAGNTMMGPALGKPTVLIWNGFFPPGFHRNACIKKNHVPKVTSDGGPKIASAFLRILKA